MKNLVQDLLDYAQIKSGKFRKNIKSFDLKKTVEEVISIQEKQAESKNINLYS